MRPNPERPCEASAIRSAPVSFAISQMREEAKAFDEAKPHPRPRQGELF